jgi:hypothetical protein
MRLTSSWTPCKAPASLPGLLCSLGPATGHDGYRGRAGGTISASDSLMSSWQSPRLGGALTSGTQRTRSPRWAGSPMRGERISSLLCIPSLGVPIPVLQCA